MRLLEFTSSVSDEEVTPQQLKELEHYLDMLYDRNNIDFKFTKHFLDRVNDDRNKRQITTGELFNMFGKAQKEYGNEIAGMGDQAQAVISDIGSKINSPFVLNWNPTKRMYELVAKTVMRKPDFRSPDPKLSV